MISFDATQTALVAGDYKKLSWLFTVTTSALTTYYWSTKAKTFDGQAYDFKIIPDSFGGVQINRNRSEAGLQAPSTVNFRVTNKDSALEARDFKNATVQIDLVLSNGTDEEIVRSFKFVALHVLPQYQCMDFQCEDFIQQFLNGDYPTGRLSRDIFPSDDQDDAQDITPPVPFGWAYPPLLSVYTDTARQYIMGPASSKDYQVAGCFAPADYASQSEWESGVNAGLIHYLKLDEGTGTTAADSTMFGNDGTLGGGGPTSGWITAGKINGAYLVFDVLAGVSTGIDCGNSAPLSGIGNPDNSYYYQAVNRGFAVNFWLKAVSGTNYDLYIFHKKQDASNHIQIFRDATSTGGELSIAVNGVTHETSLTTNIWNASWHLITFNFEKTGDTDWTVKTYVGDTLEDTYVFSAIGSDISNTGDLIWGGDGTYGCNFFLDECRIYNHPLTTAEMAVLEAYTAADFFTFTQSSKTDAQSKSWDVVAPIIADADNDGVADSQGLFWTNRSYLPVPVCLARSDTYNLVNPADVIEFVLEDMGVASGDIDTGAGSTFETAAEVFTERGLEYHGAFYEKQTRAKTLAMLLNQCGACLDVSDKVELRVRTKAAQAAITAADVVKQVKKVGQKETLASVGTFRASAGQAQDSDSGYVEWQAWGRPQDRSYKSLVSAKTSDDSASGITLQMPFVHDSIQIQKLGKMAFQRLFMLDSYRSFTGKLTLLGLQPDDVVRFNADNYGGCYSALVDSLFIYPNGNIDVRVITFQGKLTSLRNASYKWTASGSGTIEFYLELAAGGDPGISEPDIVIMNGISRLMGTVGALTDYTWAYGDNDSLGYDTVYVRLTQSEVISGHLYVGGDPDARDTNFIQAEIALDDWDDLSPSALSIATDDTNDFEVWSGATSGPSGIEVVQNLWAGMGDKFCLTVSPTPNEAMFLTIDAALAQVPSDGARILLKNGTYTHTGSITVPNKNLLIEGESQGGVVLQNNPGDDLFVLHNPTGLAAFRNFSIASQNTSTYSKMFNIYGDTAAENTAQVLVDQINFNLADAGTYKGNGDYGVYGYLSDGLIKISQCYMDGGKYPIFLDTYDVVEISTSDILNAIYNAIYVKSSEYAIFSNRLKDFWYRGIEAGISSTGEQSAILSNRLASKDIAANSHQTGIVCNGIGGRVAENTIIMTNIPASAGTMAMAGISDYQNTAMNGNTIKIYTKTSSIICIWVGDDSQASGNIMLFDDNGAGTGTKTGVQVYGDRAIVMNNQVDGTNSDVTDIGINLQSTAADCFAVNNLLANVGTTVSDAGTGNTTSPNMGV